MVFVPLKLAWKPKEVLPPAAMAPLKEALFAVTAVPLEVTVAFHEFTIDWLPPQVQVTFQVLVATVPGLLTVTLAVKPLLQLLPIAYAAEQRAEPEGPGVPVRAGVGVAPVARERLPRGARPSRAR